MQKTLNASVEFSGIGLHTGQVCGLRLSPSPDFGFFVLEPNNEITRIDEYSITGGMLGTNVTLRSGKVIRTVEHLLAAIVSLGITNVIIEVTGSEVPVMDGSSGLFVQLIQAVGVKDLDEPVPELELEGVIKVASEDKWIEITPRDDSLKVFNVEIDFQNPVVDAMPQVISYCHSRDGFVDNIANARTFGFQGDIEKLLAMKLCIGGSTNNAVVITQDGVLNPDGLRFDNELVAHKLLDLIGDLSPALPMLKGFDLKAYKPGHMLNNKLLVRLLDLKSK